jgi:hypothetical protein
MSEQDEITILAKHLANVLRNNEHEIAEQLVADADGHDDRMGLVKALLSLAGAVAMAVESDTSAVGDGYDVCSQTGETHDGNGTADEGRAMALHYYACALASTHVWRKAADLEVEFDKLIEKANDLPSEINAEQYLKTLESLS